jgi:hypothetical protein
MESVLYMVIVNKLEWHVKKDRLEFIRWFPVTVRIVEFLDLAIIRYYLGFENIVFQDWIYFHVQVWDRGHLLCGVH